MKHPMQNPYYNSKEGEQCLNKVLYLSYYGLKAGAMVSVFDVLLYSHSKGYIATFTKVFQWTGRFICPLATFAALSCSAYYINPPKSKKNYINYVIPGGISGVMFGAMTQSAKRAIGFGLFGLVVATFFKDSLIYDYKLCGPTFIDADWLFDKTLYVKKRSPKEKEEISIS